MSECDILIEAMASASGDMSNQKQEALGKLLQQLTVKLQSRDAAMGELRSYYGQNAQEALVAQLDAIEKRVERAGDAIMSSAEALMAVAGKKGLDAEVAQQISHQVNAIFETCTFQDLICQHVQEVRLLLAPLDEALGQSGDAVQLAQSREHKADKDLLNGPTTNI